MIYFTCTVCRTHLSVDDRLGGQHVKCPTCLSAQQVPVESPAGVGGPASEPGGAAQPRVPPPFGGQRAQGRRYGFNCPYCSSRLDANEALAGTDGQCPTCGSEITIPIMDKYGRLIDPKTRQIIKQDPHPVHAYAAAGKRAPRIVRTSDGSQHIQCQRCQAYSPISANNCRQCGYPFTMEGTTAEVAGAANGYCVASLVLGIISIPAACTLILPALAIIFGIIGYNQAAKTGSGGKGMAIAGMVCGGIAAVMVAFVYI